MPLRAQISTVLTTATALFTGGQPYDLVDLATVKDELSIADSASDRFLSRVITQASLNAASYCNRVFVAETLKDEFWPQRDRSSVVGGVEPLQLTRWPVACSPCLAGIAAPTMPVLSQVAGGSLGAARYYVTITYVTANGETPVSVEANLSASASNLLRVASPVADKAGLATGFNVYVGTASGKGTLQNVSPIAIGTAWTEPTSGLVAGTVAPSVVSVIENAVPLAEGVDFRVDFQFGQLVRLDSNFYPRRWLPLSILVQYPAGYAAIPADLQDAAIRMVKGRWFARLRDPQIRSESAVGIFDAQYWFGAGPGSDGGLPPDVAAILDGYRVPVAA